LWEGERETQSDAFPSERDMPLAMRDFSRASGTHPRKPGWLKLVYHASAFWRPLPEIANGHPFENWTSDSKLAKLIGSNAEMCEYLVQLFATQQESHREPLSPASAAVLRISYPYIHVNPTDGKYAQKELSKGVNLNLERLHETFRLPPHEVGRALTSRGLTNRKRTDNGFIAWLDLRTRKRIHKLAHDHGIDEKVALRGEPCGQDCELC